MMRFNMMELAAAYPEISLAVLAMLLLLFGISRSKEDYHSVANLSVAALLAALAAVAMQCRSCHEGAQAFNGMFITDGFTGFMKALVLIGSTASILLAARYVERQRIMRFEYPILMLFATLGMMLMISANDLIALYMGLELQSLPLYVLASLQRDTVRSTEAGLKYFVLGALSSGILLYGASLIYGYTGATGFNAIGAALAHQGGQAAGLGIIVGMVMLLSGLAFKISAVPFHMWTPDVYEGAPTSVTAFFAIAPKLAALALLTRVFMGPFLPLAAQWQQVVCVIAVATMALGAVAAIGQSNIKRLLAYSSIGNMGYALVGLAAANEEGVRAIMIYAAIYMIMSIGAFAIVLMMKQKDRMVEQISDLSGLAERQPLLALAMTIMMFSMAGVPPLAGFFGKLFVFQAAIGAGLYTLAVIGVIASVVAAYYYLRIIRVMYFESAGDEAIDPAEDRPLNLLLAGSSLLVVLFIAFPGPLLSSAQAGAQSLLAAAPAMKEVSAQPVQYAAPVSTQAAMPVPVTATHTDAPKTEKPAHAAKKPHKSRPADDE
jgi:NADH-quinone oxidoreductase subunit N